MGQAILLVSLREKYIPACHTLSFGEERGGGYGAHIGSHIGFRTDLGVDHHEIEPWETKLREADP